MDKKIGDMQSTGQTMANEKHFDADNILKACDKLKDRFQELKVTMLWLIFNLLGLALFIVQDVR